MSTVLMIVIVHHGVECNNARVEAKLVPYNELRDQRADKRFFLQWSVRASMDDQSGKILEEV